MWVLVKRCFSQYIVSVDSAVNEYQASCLGKIEKVQRCRYALYPAQWTVLSYFLPAQNAAKGCYHATDFVSYNKMPTI